MGTSLIDAESEGEYVGLSGKDMDMLFVQTWMLPAPKQARTDEMRVCGVKVCLFNQKRLLVD